MKKGQIYTGKALSVSYPNKTVVEVMDSELPEDNGQKVIVKNVIPGETIKFLLHKNKNDRREGILREVVTKAETETRERCAYFGTCGGCVYQPVDYDEQLKMKEEQIRTLFSHVIHYDYEFQPITGSPEIEGYRNKMEFTFGDEVKDGDMRLGMHKSHSMFDIVPVDGCKICSPDFSTVRNAVEKFVSESGIPFYHKKNWQGYFRFLIVRQSHMDGSMLLDLVTTSQIEPEAEEKLLADFVSMLTSLSLNGSIAGILHTVTDSTGDAVSDEGTTVLYGKNEFTEELLELQFKVTIFSFFQTNTAGAERLYSKVREYVGETKDKVIFDLYSGTGTIAQILAPVAKKVIGVEIVEEAVEAAKENAKLNGLTNCEFIAGDVLKKIDEIEDKPDFIVLDPPRDGVHPKALSKIIDYGVENLVYISCKSTSLVRDLPVFHAAGYRVVKAATVDLFPGTAHVESLVLLSKKNK